MVSCSHGSPVLALRTPPHTSTTFSPLWNAQQAPPSSRRCAKLSSKAARTGSNPGLTIPSMRMVVLLLATTTHKRCLQGVSFSAGLARSCAETRRVTRTNSRLVRDTSRPRPSVGHRTLDARDDEHVDRRPARFKLQTKLFLNRRGERHTRRIGGGGAQCR